MEVTREEFDTLRARFEELAAVVYSRREPASVSRETSEASERPMWICREMAASSGTFTAGVDWEPQFEIGTVAYVDHGISTNCGELFIHLDTSHGRAMKAVLKWDSPINRTVNAYLNADNFGRVQYKLNSQDTTEKTADGSFTLDVREGENVFVLMTNGNVDRLEFKAGLF